MSPQLLRICQLFPDHAFMVAQLARRNETFLSLCEEYDLAVDALEKLEMRNSHAPADLLRTAEYRALIEELKFDLLRQLKASGEAGRP